jgi:flagella basal body P-ring formation protein FlgA
MPHFKKHTCCLLLSLAALGGAATASAAELHLRREATPAGALATLGDVAEIYATAAGEAEQLARVELFPAPPQGSSRLVRAAEIRDTLAQRGVDLRQIRLVGANSIWIHGGQAQAAPAQNAPASPVQPAVVQETIATTTQVVVPLRPLQRGDVIRASDVQLQARSGDVGHAASIEEVVGRQAVRPIAAGSTIAAIDLQSPQLVLKNEVVTVYARARGVQVRTSAKALEAGAKGDIIALESLLDRNARFMARVIGTKEVEIFAGAPVVTTPRAPPPVVAPAATPSGSLFGLRVRGTETSIQER